MNGEDEQNFAEEVAAEAGPSRSKFKIILLSLGALLIVLVGAVVVKLSLEGAGSFLERVTGSGETAKPPPSATEIIAMEFAGKIETANKVNPEELAAPPPGSLPLGYDQESREFDEDKKTAAKDIDDDEDAAEKSGDKAKGGKKSRAPASVDKSAGHLAFDKGSSKVSKNLDKKKVLELLSKKLDKSCSPKLPDKTKSVKAEVSLSKSGSIANIKVTPGAAEKELAKCMRQKLADAKVLKPKNKAVAQITVHFTVK